MIKPRKDTKNRKARQETLCDLCENLCDLCVKK